MREPGRDGLAMPGIVVGARAPRQCRMRPPIDVEEVDQAGVLEHAGAISTHSSGSQAAVEHLVARHADADDEVGADLPRGSPRTPQREAAAVVEAAAITHRCAG